MKNQQIQFHYQERERMFVEHCIELIRKPLVKEIINFLIDNKNPQI